MTPSDDPLIRALRELEREWRTNILTARCVDGDTEKPCDGIQGCADDLAALLRRAEQEKANG